MQNESGFTLIELLVATVILSVGLLGLLQAVNMGIENNMTTQFRNEATSVADTLMTAEQARPFDQLSSSGKFSVSRSHRLIFKNYSVAKTTSTVSSLTKSLQFQVSWTYKGRKFSHSISSLITKSN